METEGEEMSRYIDADAVIGRLAEAMAYETEMETGEFIDCVEDAEELLNGIPTIDIVRCKECRWRNDYGCHNPIWGDGWANYLSPSPREDDFCSYGERKESE